MSRRHWSGVAFAALVLANGCGPATTPKTPPGTEGAMRTVVLHSAPSAVQDQAIKAALQRDPLSTSFRLGGVVLGEQIVVTSRQRAEGNVMPS